MCGSFAVVSRPKISQQNTWPPTTTQQRPPPYRCAPWERRNTARHSIFMPQLTFSALRAAVSSPPFGVFLASPQPTRPLVPHGCFALASSSLPRSNPGSPPVGKPGPPIGKFVALCNQTALGGVVCVVLHGPRATQFSGGICTLIAVCFLTTFAGKIRATQPH